MPWEIRKSSDGQEYCVHKKSDGSKVACHDTEEEAKRHMSALYANEKSVGDDTLAFYGGAVKALGGGKVAGYGVLFTTVADPDLQQETFIKSTDLELEVGDRRSIYYRHGTHPIIQDRKLGKAILKAIDDAGAFFEGELNVRDEYERYIYKLAELGKLGWSTGAISHLVRKELVKENGKEATVIKSWPIGEISLTPCPVEARTSAFPVKSLQLEVDELDELIKKEEEPAVVSLEGLPALKALCEALSPTVTITKLEHSQIADAAVKELITHNKVFVDAFKHYRVRLDQHLEFRKERNRKPMSDAQSESIKSWKDGLSNVRQGIETLENDLDGTLRLSQDARARADAAEKQAKFLMQQLSNLGSIIAKE